MSDAAPRPARLRAVLPPAHEQWQAREGHALAAVLVPLTTDGDGVHVVFTKRHAGLRHHAGQYAFPGGRRDDDETPVACALREFEEELGLAREDVEILGGLPCHGSILGFFVHPIVGCITSLAGLRPQASEVELVFSVPLVALREADRWQWRAVPGRSGPRVSPFFSFGAHVIWGLTARVAHDLVDRLP